MFYKNSPKEETKSVYFPTEEDKNLVQNLRYSLKRMGIIIPVQ